MNNGTNLTRRQFLAASAAAGGVLATGGGALAQGAAADWQAGAPAEWTRILTAARAEGQVTVAAFPLLAEKLSAAFKRDTGIQLNFLGGNTAEQSARLEAEARAKNLTIDILLGGGRELNLYKQGLMEPIRPQLILPGVAPENFRNGRIEFMDNAGEFLMLGAEYVNGWLVVNKDVVKPDEIKSWKDLLNPKFKGKIASYDVRFPGPGQGVATWLYRTFGIDFIKELFLTQQTKFSVENRGLVEGVVRGTAPILIAGVQAEVERFKANFNNLAVVLPADAPGYLTAGFSVLKQAKGAPHPNAATVFINWYMSKPGQEVYESTMLETSRRTDVKTNLPDYLIPRPGVTYSEDYREDNYFARTAMIKTINEALGQR